MTRWDTMGLDGTRWGLDGTLWGSMGLDGTRWGSMGLDRTRWDSMGLNGTRWDSMADPEAWTHAAHHSSLCFRYPLLLGSIRRAWHVALHVPVRRKKDYLVFYPFSSVSHLNIFQSV